MNILVMLGMPLLACVMLSVILGYAGTHIIKREVIFIDIAVAQIAALGAVGAHLLFHLPGDSAGVVLCGIGATLLAALFFSFLEERVDRLPIEALIGITYAVAAAATLFVIGKSAEGHAHALEMLTGALLWVTPRDVLLLGAVLGGVGMIFFRVRRPLQALSDRSSAGRAMGWNFMFYALCGVVITVGVKLAGVLVVFSCLIVPSTMAAMFSDHWKTRTIFAGVAGSVASLAGLLFSYFFDFSAGASITAMMILMLAVAAMIRRVS